jgi:glycosyltransferase involved in cell wall biosynthesis
MASLLEDCCPVIVVDLAILAHNEERTLPLLLLDLAEQSVFSNPSVDLRVRVLANGCSDSTAAAAETMRRSLPEKVSERVHVHDRTQAGKSRTMNWFLKSDLRQDAELLIFMDGDIRLPVQNSLERMISEMCNRPELQVFTSRPVKDLVYHKMRVSPIARLIAAGREGLTDFRKSIAGSLFIMRTNFASRLSLPAGLPVEDGFIRAMVLTDFLSAPEDLDRIDGDPEVFHLYESVRSIKDLVSHQTRLVIGSSVNAAVFRWLRREAPSEELAVQELEKAAENDNWLQEVIAKELPCSPYGYIPFGYLTNRFQNLLLSPKNVRSVLMLFPGLALDAVVYLRASWHMSSRNSAGHW